MGGLIGGGGRGGGAKGMLDTSLKLLVVAGPPAPPPPPPSSYAYVELIYVLNLLVIFLLPQIKKVNKKEINFYNIIIGLL